MADKKITQLTNITGADLVDADEFVVVDISADETKAITLAELKTAFDSGTGFVRVTGDTMTGDLALSGADVTFGDNDKAIFGAELEIYSDATHARIREYGGGQLKIQGDNMQLLTSDGASTYLEGNASTGAVTLYHASNAPRVATTATGIDVTGTVTADGLTVGGSGTAQITSTAGTTLELIRSGSAGQISSLIMKDGGNAQNRINSSGGALEFEYGASNLNALKIDNNGDINFYATNGTTQAFHWDAADESLGIGNTAPTDKLHLGANSGSTQLKIQSAAAGNNCLLHTIGTTDSWRVGMNLSVTDGSYEIYDDVNNTTRLLISPSGNVGIGTSSSLTNLSVAGAESGVLSRVNIDVADSQNRTLTISEQKITFAAPDTYGASYNAFINYGLSSLQFGAGGSEAMRIDSNGKVGVGQVPATDWRSDYDALQVGAQGVMFAHTAGGGDASTWITNNAYVSTGGWKALSTNEASHYQQKNGEHYWSNAPSVSAGAGLAFTNRMKLDVNGNLGIGVVPSASNTLAPSLQIGNGIGLSSYNRNSYFSSNAWYDTNTFKYTATDSAMLYAQENGDHIWSSAASGSANASITFSESMRIMANGNVNIGSSSDFVASRLQVNGTKGDSSGTLTNQLVVIDEQAYSTTGNGGSISFGGNFYSGGQTIFATIQGIKENNTDSNYATALTFDTRENNGNLTERMRINSAGTAVVTSTGWDLVFDAGDTNITGVQQGPQGFIGIQNDTNGASTEAIVVNNINSLSATQMVLQYRTRQTVEGSVQGNGSGLSFVNVSDYRKKDNITNLSGSLAKIKALRPVTFTHRSAYTTDTSAVKTGMIAHEVAEVLPNLVVGEKDAVDEDGNIVLQALAYSGDEMITHLIGAIKELEATITTLTDRITALEG